jgi:hypothetical protein
MVVEANRIVTRIDGQTVMTKEDGRKHQEHRSHDHPYSELSSIELRVRALDRFW